MAVKQIVALTSHVNDDGGNIQQVLWKDDDGYLYLNNVFIFVRGVKEQYQYAEQFKDMLEACQYLDASGIDYRIL